MHDVLQQKMKGRLATELKELEGELRSIGRVNPGNPKDWEAMPDKMDIMKADPNEVADSIESYEGNTAILKQLEIRLNEVKAAQQRIGDGEYGACSVCKKPIEEKRLEANPAATTCLAHKEK